MTKVEVPVNQHDDPETCQHWKVVDIPSEVLDHLQRRNRKHFGQAQGSPFTIDPLTEQFGYSGLTATANQVLDGTYIPADGTDESVQAILSHISTINQQASSPRLQSVIS